MCGQRKNGVGKGAAEEEERALLIVLPPLGLLHSSVDQAWLCPQGSYWAKGSRAHMPHQPSNSIPAKELPLTVENRTLSALRYPSKPVIHNLPKLEIMEVSNNKGMAKSTMELSLDKILGSQ